MNSLYFLGSAVLSCLTSSFAAAPSWWHARGVTNENATSNQSIINQGQLKNLVLAGYHELEEHLPGGAGANIEDYLWGGYKTPSGILEQNPAPYAPVLNGQLKYVARLFLDRLADEGYFRTDGEATSYPWDNHPQGSQIFKTPANIGMAKALFAFDLTRDSDNDSLPDWWELKKLRDLENTEQFYSDYSHAYSSSAPLAELLLDSLCLSYTGSPNDLPSLGRGELELRLIKETTVTDVAPHCNNSLNTPLARYRDSVYWAYVSETPGLTPSELRVSIRQVELPGVARPDTSGDYPSITYHFKNNTNEPTDHELTVLANDVLHTAPSVGVDRDGYIHVTGGMHHSEWDYCISDEPGSIIEFTRINPTDASCPPHDRITYPQFFNDRDGRLYLNYRAKFSADWHNGTTHGAMAVFDESSRTWEEIGDNNYQVADYYSQYVDGLTWDQETGLIDMNPIPWPNRPAPQKTLFYSSGGVFHRYFRDPATGDRVILENEGQPIFNNNSPVYASTESYAYEGYWQDVKFDRTGRMHVCCIITTSPTYSGDNLASVMLPLPESVRVNNSNINVTGPAIEYDEKTYTMNFDHGMALLYAYSDDGGASFRTPNGNIIPSLPLCAEPLKNQSGQAIAPNLTVQNGGVVRAIENTRDLALSFLSSITILSDGSPLIRFRENYPDGSYHLKALKWTGSGWGDIEAEDWIAGGGGGIVGDDQGNIWSFLSHNYTNGANPTSSGSKVGYLSGGLDGDFTIKDIGAWRNGLRVDRKSISFSGVIRFVDMDIQSGGEANIYSIVRDHGK